MTSSILITNRNRSWQQLLGVLVLTMLSSMASSFALPKVHNNNIPNAAMKQGIYQNYQPSSIFRQRSLLLSLSLYPNKKSTTSTLFPFSSPLVSSSSSSKTRLFARKLATPPPPPSFWDRLSKVPILGNISTWLVSIASILFSELKQLTRNQKILFVAIFLIGLKFGTLLSSSAALNTQRFISATDVPSMYFGPSAPKLTGRVASVSDGDTFRFYHTPTRFHKSTLDKDQKLSDNTMPIRICTYDTPETPKFGKPGQPFGLEAKDELQNLIGDRMVQIRLLQKDQYGRAVAQVFLPNSSSKCVDEVMLEKGLGEVYTGMGAVYGPKGKDYYVELEAKAKKAKKGIWSQGDNRESAAEYKRRTKS